MKVLSVASEVFPLIKTGGLADVAGALPLALAPLGVEMRTLLPGYPSVLGKIGEATVVAELPSLIGAPARILFVRHAGLDLYVLDQPVYFDRPGGPYTDAGGRDHEDNWRRFAALSMAANRLCNGLDPDWTPELLHGHDWQAGLAPVYLKYSPASARVPSLMTIHNIAFPGRFWGGIFGGLELPAEAYHSGDVEYYGDVAYLKAGLRTAWAINTVSPTYAEEIKTPQYGMGLEGLMQAREANLSGIVNGIDPLVWDPSSDGAIAVNYTPSTLERRTENRLKLRKRFGLSPSEGPLFCVISRLTHQKGIDLIAAAVDRIVADGGSLAVLGAGDSALEAQLRDAAERHPDKVGLVLGYDEPLSHLMQAGADAILIPSRFEPCGLTQLYGLRYGCIPIVARTGGLADTVIDANGAALTAGVATGIQFSPVTEAGLNGALTRAFKLFADHPLWTGMQRAAMRSDVSWIASARQYAHIYETLRAKV
ncbi:glycogen synthase GlgA [Rhizobium sp. FKL33]|uniref:glycogen synthase GlgA n=1 Tax=Rhizobium sp. FKL33 TaxID=2562307 RepID=UPI0010C11E8D|nr:glycogen synthase GlgA [Rhizobium sp. FKL33]